MRRSARAAAAFCAALLAACSTLEPARAPDHTFSEAHPFGATAVAFSPTADLLASGGHRGEILLWRLTPPERFAELHLHTDSVRALKFGATGRLYSGGDDGRLVLWDPARRLPVAQRQSAGVNGLVVGAERVISGHDDGYLRAWAAADLAPLAEVAAGAAVVALDGRDGLLAVSLAGGRVALYDYALRWQRDLQASGPLARDLRFTPDGRQLVAGSWFDLLLWDLESGTQRAIPTEHFGLITSVDVSPDGQRLASLGRHTDSAVRLWNRADLGIARRYQSHAYCGAMIRFSPDGRYFASASDDESVRLYRLEPAARSDAAR